MAWTAVVVGRQPVWTMELLSSATFNIAVGATYQGSARAVFENGDTAPRTIVWSTSNAGIASVNASTGLVTGVAAGSVTITATCEGFTVSALGTITSPTQNTVASVVTSTSAVTVSVNGATNFTVQAKDASGNVLPGKTFTAVSSQPSKATVTVSGSTITVQGVATGAPTPAITVTCDTINSAPVAVTVTAIVAGFPNKPGGMIDVINRTYLTKATLTPPDNHRGTGSLPNKVGGSEGWDNIEDRYSFLSIISDATAPFSPSNVMAFKYPAHTVPTGTTFTPGTSQTLDFQNVLYAALGVSQMKRMYVRFAHKISANWYGNPTLTNKIVFLRTTQGGFEPIFRLRGAYGGPHVVNVDLQGSEGPGGDPRASSGGLNPNTAGAQAIGAFDYARGVWHTFELEVATGVKGQADGELHIWMDGVKTHQYTDIQYFRNSTPPNQYWASWHMDPTYGGGGGIIPADQYQYIDEVRISLKAA